MPAPRILACLLILAGTLAGGAPAWASTSQLVAQLDRLSEGFPGGVGLWVADPAAPSALYERNADEPVIAASLYKLGVLVEAERRIETGELRYTDRITVAEQDVSEDGSFTPAGAVLTVDEALEAMITVSDNGPALALWRLLGPADIDETLERAGIADFHVALGPGEENVVTPRAVGTLLALLAERQLVSPAASDRMLARLERQRINDRLPAALPDGARVAHKTGNLPGVTHDAGIILTPSGPRVVVAMTWDVDEGEADAFIADVGAIVYSAVLEPPANARYEVPRAPLVVETGARTRVTLALTNTGIAAWSASGRDALGLVWELRDGAGALVSASPVPIALPALAPGGRAHVGMDIDAPDTVGRYRVVVGLVDGRGNGLASRGAATASFAVSVHEPYRLRASADLPGCLHSAEASLVTVRYDALGRPSEARRTLVLVWRALDPRTGSVVEEGSAAAGDTADASGVVVVPLVAPGDVGAYRFAYELWEDGAAASETVTTVLVVVGPRTDAGEIEAAEPPGSAPGTVSGSPSAEASRSRSRSQAPMRDPAGGGTIAR